MTLYQYMRTHGDHITTMVKAGMLSPKYLLWRDMYEYVHAQTNRKKKFRRKTNVILKEAAGIFHTNTRTIERAISAMKKEVNYAQVTSEPTRKIRSN